MNTLFYNILLISLDICLIIICITYFYLKLPIKYSKINDENRDYQNLLQSYKIIKRQKKAIRRVKFKLFIVHILPIKTVKNHMKKGIENTYNSFNLTTNTRGR